MVVCFVQIQANGSVSLESNGFMALRRSFLSCADAAHKNIQSCPHLKGRGERLVSIERTRATCHCGSARIVETALRYALLKAPRLKPPCAEKGLGQSRPRVGRRAGLTPPENERPPSREGLVEKRYLTRCGDPEGSQRPCAQFPNG